LVAVGGGVWFNLIDPVIRQLSSPDTAKALVLRVLWGLAGLACLIGTFVCGIKWEKTEDPKIKARYAFWCGVLLMILLFVFHDFISQFFGSQDE